MSHLDDFLARYPTDDGTTFRCECGHPRWQHHHTLDACTFWAVGQMRYCPCLAYRQKQTP